MEIKIELENLLKNLKLKGYDQEDLEAIGILFVSLNKIFEENYVFSISINKKTKEEEISFKNLETGKRYSLLKMLKTIVENSTNDNELKN